MCGVVGFRRGIRACSAVAQPTPLLFRCRPPAAGTTTGQREAHTGNPAPGHGGEDIFHAASPAIWGAGHRRK